MTEWVILLVVLLIAIKMGPTRYLYLSTERQARRFFRSISGALAAAPGIQKRAAFSIDESSPPDLSWREKAKNDARVRHQYAALTADDQLVNWRQFGGVDPHWGSYGTYFEIYCNLKLRTISVVGCGFHGAEGVFYQEIQPIKCDPINIERTGAVILDFTCLVNGSMEIKAKIIQHVDLEMKIWTLYGVDIEFTNIHFRGRNQSTGKYPPPAWRWANLSQSPVITTPGGREGDVICPTCLGTGSFVSMAIPKADINSGATGYALYSLNMVNGTLGCKRCGGSGGVLEKWYLDENRDRFAPPPKLVSGTGIIRLEPMSRTQNLI